MTKTKRSFSETYCCEEKGSFNFGKGRKLEIIFVGKRNVPSASSANLSKTGVRNQLVFFLFLITETIDALLHPF